MVVDDGVQFITLNRPDKLNAFNREMFVTLPRTFKAAENDPNIKVTVLSGR